MSDIIRIALCGKMRCGKSSVATHLYVNYPGFRTVSFGTKLKQAADDLLGDSPLYQAEDIKVRDPFGGEMTILKRKPRRLYQTFGQAMRELDPDVWIRHAASSVQVYENYRDTRGIIIDDLRQPNEEKWARENGFTIVRISANEDTRIARAKEASDDFSEEDLRHSTEQYIDDFEADYDVWNDGDLSEVKRRIDEIMSEIKAKGGR